MFAADDAAAPMASPAAGDSRLESAGKCTRPALRWFGGKWRDAPWIISHFGPHDCYCEPYGGAYSVGIRKAPVRSEIFNDLDGRLVAFFRLLRDEALAAELIRQLRLTPYSRAEFDAAYEPTDDPIEEARRMVVRSFMGHGADSTAGHYRTGFRGHATDARATAAREWSSYPDALLATVQRLRPVLIEQRPALELIAKYDRPRTLFYVDPPYLPETRSHGNRRRCGPGTEGFEVYRHELKREDHVELLEALRGVRGMVVLSGYPSALYDDTLAGWQRFTRPARADSGEARTEVLWLNAAAAAVCPRAGLI